MKFNHIPVYVIVAIVAVVVWFLENASDENGEIFRGLPLLP